MPRQQTLAGTPPTIARGPGATVHAQIEDWLAGAIAAGRLAPGDRLPAEQHLAVWFGVSRMTLRHALGELSRRGLLTRAVGRGGPPAGGSAERRLPEREYPPPPGPWNAHSARRLSALPNASGPSRRPPAAPFGRFTRRAPGAAGRG